MSLPEKGRASDCLAAEQSALCSPVYSGLVAKYGHISRISIKDVQVFSAVKTCWRREWDSIIVNSAISRHLKNINPKLL